MDMVMRFCGQHMRADSLFLPLVGFNKALKHTLHTLFDIALHVSNGCDRV